MAVDRTSPEFLRYYAKVLLREAKARRGTEFSRWLLDGAMRARREAMAFRPAQGDLFSEAR